MRPVLHVTRDFPPRIHGGLSIMVQRIIGALARHEDATVVSFDGWRPRARGRVAASPPSQNQVRPGLRVIRVTGPDQLPALSKLLEPFDADFINLHDPLLLPLVSDWPIAGRRPLLLTIHVLHAEQNRLRGVQQTASGKAEEAAMANADRIQVLSSTCAEVVLDHYPAASRRLRLAPPGADMPQGDDPGPAAQPGEGAPEFPEVVRQDRPGPSRPQVLFAGRFSDLKGLDHLMEAFPVLHQARPGTTLRIVGGNPDNPASEERTRRRLEARLTDECLAALIWERWLDTPTLAARMQHTSVVAAPSRFETFGLTSIEAIRLRTPVVARATGRVADLAPLLDGRVLLVREGQLDLASALESALDAAPPEPLPRSLAGQLEWQTLLPDWLALHDDVARAP